MWDFVHCQSPFGLSIHQSCLQVLVHLANIFWASECARPGAGDAGVNKAQSQPSGRQRGKKQREFSVSRALDKEEIEPSGVQRRVSVPGDEAREG